MSMNWISDIPFLSGNCSVTKCVLSQILCAMICCSLEYAVWAKGTKLINHVTPASTELHWLPIRNRIQFKLCLVSLNTVYCRCMLIKELPVLPECSSYRASKVLGSLVLLVHNHGTSYVLL